MKLQSLFARFRFRFVLRGISYPSLLMLMLLLLIYFNFFLRLHVCYDRCISDYNCILCVCIWVVLE